MKTMLHGSLLADSPVQEEIDLENECIQAGARRYRKLVDETIARGDGASLKPAERWILRWLNPMIEAVREDLSRFRHNKPDVGINVWGPPMKLAGAESVAFAALQTALSICMSQPEGVKASALANAIGRAVMAEGHAKMLRGEEMTQIRVKPDGTSLETSSSAWAQLVAKYKTLNPRRVNWWAKKKLTSQDPYEQIAQTHIGGRLLYHLLTACNCSLKKATQNEDGSLSVPWTNAFHRWRDKNGAAMITADHNVFKLIDDGHAIRELLRPRYSFMLHAPYPWVQKEDADTGERYIEGGYAVIRTPLVAKIKRDQKTRLAERDKTKIFERLSAASATALRINTKVMDVANALTGSENVPGIPSMEQVAIPERPDWDALSDKEKKAWKRELAMAHKAARRRAADRIMFYGRMAEAHRFCGRDKIYAPHQLDFRQRAYPIPSPLNFHGDDLCRGLLELGEEKPVESELGHRALKLHAASCFGLDKASIESRLVWADANMDRMLRVAREPLDDHWWMQADDGDQAWQFLAACFALADPTGAGSRLPIKRDGTANGFQHYAAMGLDPIGAASVNLLPATEQDTPADPYGNVATVADQIIRASGSPLALVLDGKINRWVVKPNVMTKTYGVTAVGARMQVTPRLLKMGVPKEHVYEAATFLSKIVLASIGNVCPSATAIMDWLKQCAGLIATTTKARKGETIEWVTPLGFPVVQPYKNWRNRRIETVSGSIYVGADEDGLPPKTRKQVSGLAPNFIHSVDATHMFEVAYEAARRGISFVGVHDAFWSHAEDFDELGEITREKFIELHKRDLTADLFLQFKARYKIDLPPPPPRGTFDLDSVRQAIYLFN